MCATIAAMAAQITKTQIATAMAAEISDIVSSFTFMILRNCALHQIPTMEVSLQHVLSVWPSLPRRLHRHFPVR